MIHKAEIDGSTEWRKLVALLATFVIAGAPLTLYAWRVLSDALEGHFDGRAIPAAAAFVILFLFLARRFGSTLARIGSGRSEATDEG